MIQLNNVTSSAASSAAGSLASFSNAATMENFQNALSEAVAQTLEKFGINPNSVNISIAPAGEDLSVSSLLPHVENSPTASTASNDSPLAASVSPASIKDNHAPPANAGANPAMPDSAQAFDQAYWAKQPAAVQALRNMEDPDQRKLVAAQLAGQGFAIDVPIMVWGWDPSEVTALRQSFGYTWVPSALQKPVESVPGVTFPGVPSYDPNNPPSGSIAV